MKGNEERSTSIRTRNREPRTENRERQPQRKGSDIAERLLVFAIGVLEVAADLSQTPVGNHIRSQLIRAGTSGPANYEEARSGESRADFVHKIGVATKEVRETLYWLRLIRGARMVRNIDIEPFIDEADQLVAILTSSRNTAKSRRES